MISRKTTAIIVAVLSIVLWSCEQEYLDPILVTEDGAGTLENYKAYSISSMGLPSDSAYGRVVFWETLDQTSTLVQMSLYNAKIDTANGSNHSYTASLVTTTYEDGVALTDTTSLHSAEWTREIQLVGGSLTTFPESNYYNIYGPYLVVENSKMGTDEADTVFFDQGYVTYEDGDIESPLDTFYVSNYLHFAEFLNFKYFTVGDADFYGNLNELDAHVLLKDTDDVVVASGMIGKNADPVEEN